ncbi:uncharacterized protein LOC141698223 isoform X2 [Apium graveolens]|uniref:uncharacterized protein LOC141698223 isoform X2 n=1 Tax=Apium graveolens TaxID=4045 RepID=UPI003D7ACEAE
MVALLFCLRLACRETVFTPSTLAGMSWSWVLEVLDSEDRLVGSGGIPKAFHTAISNKLALSDSKHCTGLKRIHILCLFRNRGKIISSKKLIHVYARETKQTVQDIFWMIEVGQNFTTVCSISGLHLLADGSQIPYSMKYKNMLDHTGTGSFKVSYLRVLDSK